MEERTESMTEKQEFRTLRKVQKIAWWVIIPIWLLNIPWRFARIWKPEFVRGLFDRFGQGFVIALIVLYVCFFASVLVAIVCKLIWLVYRRRQRRGTQEEA